MTSVFGARGPNPTPDPDEDRHLTGGYTDAEIADDGPATTTVTPDPDGVITITSIDDPDPYTSTPDPDEHAPGAAGSYAKDADDVDDNGHTVWQRDRMRSGKGKPSVPKAAIDWPEVKRRYVEGVKMPDRHDWPSLDAVAEHFKLSAHTVRERSKFDGWVEAKRRWQQQVETTRQNARAAALAKKGIAVDNTALDSAQLGLELIQAALTDDITDMKARRDKKQVTQVDVNRQVRLAQAADLWHKIGLRAIGGPETHRVELTGADGKPLEIATELRRDDPNRMTAVLAVLEQAGLKDLFVAGEPTDPTDTTDPA